MRAVYYVKTGKAKEVLNLGSFDDPIPRKNQVV